jgi:rare lipoprotein A
MQKTDPNPLRVDRRFRSAALTVTVVVALLGASLPSLASDTSSLYASRRATQCSASPGARLGADEPLWARWQRGLASWYGSAFHDRRTASGERFDMNDLTAAHRTLPFGTEVKVRNPNNNRSVVVRINDRGPFTGNRSIDLSRAAASALGILGRGTAQVELLLEATADKTSALIGSVVGCSDSASTQF